MIGGLSKRPTGSSPEALFMQEQWDSRFHGRAADGPGVLTSRTTRGVFRRPIVQRGGGGISIVAYRFKVKGGDYMTCRSWNFETETEGTKEINVALPFDIRDSLITETIDGRVITYSDWDSDEQTRVATDDSDPPKTETQVIVPRYVADRIILAVSLFTGVMDDSDPPKKVTLMELNSARAYCKQA